MRRAGRRMFTATTPFWSRPWYPPRTLAFWSLFTGGLQDAGCSVLPTPGALGSRARVQRRRACSKENCRNRTGSAALRTSRAAIDIRSQPTHSTRLGDAPAGSSLVPAFSARSSASTRRILSIVRRHEPGHGKRDGVGRAPCTIDHVSAHRDADHRPTHFVLPLSSAQATRNPVSQVKGVLRFSRHPPAVV